MQHKEKKWKTSKIILRIVLVIITITSIVITIIDILKPTDALKGTFVYNESVKYEFNGKGKGALYDKETEYRYTYSIEGNILNLKFKNESVRDASYTFTIENNILTLIGGEGTVGGEYILERQSQ